MATIAVGDRVLITLTGTLFQQRTMNTFLYRVSAVAPDTNYESFADALHDEILVANGLADLYRAITPANWGGYQIWIQVIRPVRLRKIAFSWPITGTYIGEATTANVQGSITRFGEAAGRDQIGGVRIPVGTDIECLDSGRIATPLLSNMGDLAEFMMANIALAFGTATLVPQVGVPKGAAASIDCVEAIQQETARVIRRRTVGHGI